MANVAQTGELFPPNLLDEIRSRFLYVQSDPFSGYRIFFDSASGSLRLRSVLEAMTIETALPDQLGRATPGSYHAGETMAKGLEDVRLFLGAKSGHIMPAMSSTHAIFRIVSAVMGHISGSNVVTTQLEHPSVYDSTRYFSELTGKEWRVAPLDRETGSVSPEAILEKIDKDTCLLAFIHASNITGAILDAQTIINEARKINPEIYVLIDGVQYAPHGEIDVEALEVDGYVIGLYKVYCVKGMGFAYLSDRLASLPHWKLRGKPATDWFLGSPENQTYAAWSAVVDYLCWLGTHLTDSPDRRQQLLAAMNGMHAHERALMHRALYGADGLDGLVNMEHIKLCGMGGELSRRVCLISFNLDGLSTDQGVVGYRDRCIRVHNRVSDAYSKHALEALGETEVIRLSGCHYNTPEEIDRFLQATTELSAGKPSVTKPTEAKRSEGVGE